MKKLYEITNTKGLHLCYQVAESPQEAVRIAKLYNASAVFANYIRDN
jgi:hypothetical protein